MKKEDGSILRKKDLVPNPVKISKKGQYYSINVESLDKETIKRIVATIDYSTQIRNRAMPNWSITVNDGNVKSKVASLKSALKSGWMNLEVSNVKVDGNTITMKLDFNNL